MDLTSYIKKQGGTGTLACEVLVSIAKKASCATGTLHLIALGHRAPGWKLAQRIEAATGGKVTARSLRPDVFGGAGKRAA